MTMHRAWATVVRRSLGLVLLGATGLAVPAAAQLARVSTSRDAVKVLVALLPHAPNAKPDAPVSVTLTGTLAHPRLR